ncbi:MAG: class I SAM-dependent methyltransferase, partial [Candidatus Aenigmatarchaeota archaeon]
MKGEEWRGEAKKIWRYKMGTFIDKIYGSKDPEYLNVLCLPGSDALEIYEVYDRMGIPPENIHGVESDEENFESLKERAPDINLYQEDIFEFLEETDETFDIISLDFMGSATPSKISGLSSIGYRELLGEGGIVSTNFYGTREHPDTQELYKNSIYNYLTGKDTNGKLINDLVYGDDIFRDSELDEIVEKKNYDELKGMRKDSITRLLINALSKVTGTDEADPKSEAYFNWSGEGPFKDTYIEEIYEENKKSGTTEQDYESFSDFLYRSPLTIPIAAHGLSILIYSLLNENNGLNCNPGTTSYIKESMINRYIPLDIERYKYISDKNSPMYPDMMFLRKFESAYGPSRLNLN